MSELYSLPSWILNNFLDEGSVFSISVNKSARMKKYCRSPDLKPIYKKTSKYNPSSVSNYKKSRKVGSLNKVKKRPENLCLEKNNFYDSYKFPIKTSKYPNSMFKIENFKLKQKKKYQPRINALPPIKNQLARSIANNALISSIEIKYNSSDEENNEWNNSESEDEGKVLEEYLKKYLYKH